MILPMDRAWDTIMNPETMKMNPNIRLNIGTNTNYLIVLLV